MKFFVLVIFLCAASLHADPWSFDPPVPPRLLVGDSLRWVGMQVRLGDSLALGAPGQGDRLDNSTWFRLDFSGRMNSIWTWRSSAQAFTDLTQDSFPTHDYSPAQGYPFNRHSPGRRTWDHFTAHSRWDFSGMALWLAVDHLRWGPARRNPLAWRGDQSILRPFLSDDRRLQQPAPFPMLGFESEIAWVRYTQWTGALRHHPTLDKYVHAHRLDFRPLPGLQLGIGESVYYGSVQYPPGTNPNIDSVTRNWEPLYTLPFVPYFFAEHYAGDRDNVTMSLDVSWQTNRSWELYGELFLDDLKSPTAFADDSWWGNKWALTLGTEWKPKFGKTLQPRWTLEWTRIEPWVYTHHLGSAHRPDHFGRNLATELGPNAMETWTRIALENLHWEVGLSAAAGAKDSTHGSDPTDIHNVALDPKDKKFLNPATTRRWAEWGLDLRYSPRDWFHLRTKALAWSGDFAGYRWEGVAELSY